MVVWALGYRGGGHGLESENKQSSALVLLSFGRIRGKRKED